MYKILRTMSLVWFMFVLFVVIVAKNNMFFWYSMGTDKPKMFHFKNAFCMVLLYFLILLNLFQYTHRLRPIYVTNCAIMFLCKDVLVYYITYRTGLVWNFYYSSLCQNVFTLAQYSQGENIFRKQYRYAKILQSTSY